MSAAKPVPEALKVYDLAHCRAGDKGNTSNISVIAYEDRFYPFLREHLAPEKVMAALCPYR